MNLMDYINSPLFAGFLSAVSTVLVMKVDIKWIKEEICEHNDRIYNLETGNTRRKQHGMAR